MAVLLNKSYNNNNEIYMQFFLKYLQRTTTETAHTILLYISESKFYTREQNFMLRLTIVISYILYFKVNPFYIFAYQLSFLFAKNKIITAPPKGII